MRKDKRSSGGSAAATGRPTDRSHVEPNRCEREDIVYEGGSFFPFVCVFTVNMEEEERFYLCPLFVPCVKW